MFLTHQRAIMLLRLSLGITFFWFGVLKLFAVSPVQDIVKNALPAGLGQSELFLFCLAFLEILIGIAYLSNRFIKLTSIVMIVYLFFTAIAVLITQGFNPRFPVFSLAGEFVIKDLVFIGAGLVLLTEKMEREERENPQKKNNR